MPARNNRPAPPEQPYPPIAAQQTVYWPQPVTPRRRGRRLLATLCLIALTGCTGVATLPVVGFESSTNDF